MAAAALRYCPFHSHHFAKFTPYFLFVLLCGKNTHHRGISSRLLLRARRTFWGSKQPNMIRTKLILLPTNLHAVSLHPPNCATRLAYSTFLRPYFVESTLLTSSKPPTTGAHSSSGQLDHIPLIAISTVLNTLLMEVS